MKSSLIVSSLAVAGLCAVSAEAASVEAGVDFQTAYVATGATCNDGWVAQPWVSVGGLKVGDTDLPLSLGFWGNIDIEKYDEDSSSRAGRFQEIDVDVTLDLAKIFGAAKGWSWSLGYLEYDYPGHDAAADHLLKFAGGYEYETDFGTFAPGVVAKYRIGGPSQGKLEAALELGWSTDLCTLCEGDGQGDDPTKLNLGLTADVWYVNVDDVDGAETDSGLACADFKAQLKAGPAYVAATYVAQIDDDVLPDGPWGYDVEWVFSCGVAYEF